MAVRTGMVDLVDQLRTLTAASDTEFTDDELQDILDRNKWEYRDTPLYATPTRVVGGVIYLIYQIPEEAGLYFEIPVDDVLNTYFYLTDTTYTPFTFGDGDNQAVFDPNLRRITFNTNTNGQSYYLTALSYDLYGAAAEVATIQCANRAGLIDIKTDNHTLNLSQEKEGYCARISWFSSRALKYADTRIARTDQALHYGDKYTIIRGFSNQIY